MSGELVRVTPNKEKAKSMLKMAKTRLEMLETIDSAKYTTLVVEGYYEAIKELMSSILSLDGYKTMGEGAHQMLIEYLDEAYCAEFCQSEIYFLDDLRKIRNRINYDGFFVKEDYFERNKGTIFEIIEKLTAIINARLD